MNLLGVKMSDLNLEQSLEFVKGALRAKRKIKIYTPNPEILVEAYNDPSFKEILNKSDLNICDAKGVELFANGTLTRITGVDFLLQICKLAEELNKRVFLLGSESEEVLKNAKKKLISKYPNLKVVGVSRGLQIEKNTKGIGYSKEENSKLLQDINDLEPDILFVAFGHKKQEFWIDENLDKLNQVKIAMGVGGALDMISEKTKRAPILLRKIGLEWLWRLILEPSRYKRIFNAVIIFPYLCYKENPKN